MLRIALCEADREDALALRQSVAFVGRQMEFETEMDVFISAEDLLNGLRRGSTYELALITLRNDGSEGLFAARMARAILPDMQIAFLSTSPAFAMDAFELDALHYLIKPAPIEKLRAVFERYFKRTGTAEKKLEICSDTRSWSFSPSRICKIQSDNKGVDIYLRDEETPRHLPISFIKVERQLDPKVFLKISRGLIVRMDFILDIDRSTCHLRDGTHALLSRRTRQEIRKKYDEYLL